MSLQSNLSDLKEQKRQEIEEVKKNAFEEVNIVSCLRVMFVEIVLYVSVVKELGMCW